MRDVPIMARSGPPRPSGTDAIPERRFATTRYRRVPAMRGQALLAALPEPLKGASPPPVTILRAGTHKAADAASPAPAGLGASPSARSKGLPPKTKTKFPRPAISFRFGSPRSSFPLAHPGLADGQEAARCF